MIFDGCALRGPEGVEDWVGMADWAEEKEAWWRGFLDRPNGIPSHNTLSDVLGRMPRPAISPYARRGLVRQVR